MKPRASIPTTLSTFPRPKCTTIRSVMVENAMGSASTGVMSRKTIPGSGKSGTSRIRALMSSISTRYLRLRLAGGFFLDFGRGRDAEPWRAVARAAAASDVCAWPPPRSPPPRPPSRCHPDRASRLELLVAPLAALQVGEHRRRDEDRRVCADRHADEHREREVLQRLPAEQQQRQDRQEHHERGVHGPHQHLVQGEVDHARVSQTRDERRGLRVLLDLVVDHDGVVQREPEDREDRDHRLGRHFATHQRIDAQR